MRRKHEKIRQIRERIFQAEKTKVIKSKNVKNAEFIKNKFA